MSRATRWGALVLLVAAVGCSERPPTSSDRPSFQIKDGAHNGGNQHFLLPPAHGPGAGFHRHLRPDGRAGGEDLRVDRLSMRRGDRRVLDDHGRRLRDRPGGAG